MSSFLGKNENNISSSHSSILPKTPKNKEKQFHSRQMEKSTTQTNLLPKNENITATESTTFTKPVAQSLPPKQKIRYIRECQDIHNARSSKIKIIDTITVDSKDELDLIKKTQGLKQCTYKLIH